MQILAIQGSPREGGNTEIILDRFIEGAKEAGGVVNKISLYKLRFSPCIECSECDHLGECVFNDDMESIYREYLEADLLVVATPIFFYSHTSYVQAFFERFQAFWVRKYRLGLGHPLNKTPKGILLSLGATKGKKLFEGLVRSFKFVMDAGWGTYVGGIFLRDIDKKGEILKYPEILDKIKNLGVQVVLEKEENWDLDRSSSP